MGYQTENRYVLSMNYLSTKSYSNNPTFTHVLCGFKGMVLGSVEARFPSMGSRDLVLDLILRMDMVNAR